jgi:hypothetical protein
MDKPSVSLIDISTYLPGEPIAADYYAQFAESDALREKSCSGRRSFAITSARMRVRST